MIQEGGGASMKHISDLLSIFCLITFLSIPVLSAGISDPSPTPPPSNPSPTCSPSPSPTWCIPEWCWLERELPESCEAGEEFEVYASIRGGSANIVFVEETVPHDWVITSPGWTKNGDTYSRGNSQLGDETIPVTTGSLLYTIKSPPETAGGNYTFSGWTRSYHWCNGYVDHLIDGDNTIILLDQTPTPTPSPDPVISPTPTSEYMPSPTPAPNQCHPSSVNITMPKHDFYPGDTCACSITICNSTSDLWNGYRLFAALQIAGCFYFAPDFTHFDYITMSFLPGETRYSVLDEFIWPEGASSYEDAIWYAALMDPTMANVIGNISSFDFSWHE